VELLFAAHECGVEAAEHLLFVQNHLKLHCHGPICFLSNIIIIIIIIIRHPSSSIIMLWNSAAKFFNC